MESVDAVLHNPKSKLAIKSAALLGSNSPRVHYSAFVPFICVGVHGVEHFLCLDCVQGAGKETGKGKGDGNE